MRGYMTMKQAFECDDNDIPFIEGGYNDIKRPHCETKKGLVQYDSLGLSVLEIFSDKWQVRKAGPKVLTVKELLDGSTHTAKDDRVSFDHNCLMCLILDSQRNGRFERDLELRDVIQCINDNWASLHDDGYDSLLGYVKNLKPLNKDEP